MRALCRLCRVVYSILNGIILMLRGYCNEPLAFSPVFRQLAFTTAESHKRLFIWHAHGCRNTVMVISGVVISYRLYINSDSK